MQDTDDVQKITVGRGTTDLGARRAKESLGCNWDEWSVSRCNTSSQQQSQNDLKRECCASPTNSETST